MRTKLQEIRRGILLRVLMFIDIGMLILAFGLAIALTTATDKWSSVASFFSTSVSLLNCVLFAIAVFLGHGLLVMCNLYESKRLSTKSAESLDILRAMSLLTLFLWCAVKLFSVSGMPPNFFLTFWAVGALPIIVSRLLLRSILSRIRKLGRNLRHVLILGTNARAVGFGRRIQIMPELGYLLLGFVDDDWSGIEEFKESGFPLACQYDGLAEFLRNNVVDEIAIYLPLRSFYERAAEIVQLAHLHGITVRFDTDIFGLKFAHRRTDAADGVPHIAANSNGIDGWQWLTKRTFDVACALVLLLLLSPLFLLVAALIKLTSPGNVFFAQKRVGLNKRPFTMYKFRTMVPAAESIQEQFAHLNEMTGAAFKIKNDPRVTSVGRILRKTSIDELPQLFNVLKGDMSLVGPRAIPLRDYQFFNEDWHRRRFSVLPGITCLWQVYGRNSIPFEQWMVLDMQYIDRWSLWLDLKILALTIPAVFRGSGAA